MESNTKINKVGCPVCGTQDYVYQTSFVSNDVKCVGCGTNYLLGETITDDEIAESKEAAGDSWHEYLSINTHKKLILEGRR